MCINKIEAVILVKHIVRPLYMLQNLAEQLYLNKTLLITEINIIFQDDGTPPTCLEYWYTAHTAPILNYSSVNFALKYSIGMSILLPQF